MKRILFVATVVRLHINMFHGPFLRWFQEQGWQVDVAANNDYDEPDDCVIPYCDHLYLMPFSRNPIRWGNLEAYRQLKKLLDREHYDIIHCHTPMGGVIARLAAGSSRKRGTKILYTAHGFHFFKGAPLLNWLVYYPVERMLSRRTDLLITINQEDYRLARNFPAKRVELVNGVGMDITRFAEAAPADKEAVRRELGLREGEVFAICVAQLIRRKNHSTLIRAISKLEDPGFHLFIVGDGVLETELRELTRELGVQDRVHFLGFRRDVHRLCGAADLFLFASYQEGLSVAVMEAMASGLPLAVSNIRGNTDLIEPGRGGFLVEPEDAEGFAYAVRSILSDRETVEQMKRHNLEKIPAYSIESVTGQMARLYRSVM